jgi:hypothetical protein
MAYQKLVWYLCIAHPAGLEVHKSQSTCCKLAKVVAKHEFDQVANGLILEHVFFLLWILDGKNQQCESECEDWVID